MAPHHLDQVRRRLFVDEPSEIESENQNLMPNLNNDINRLTKQMTENAKLKWNFDFATETPLEGEWEWEKVTPEKKPPQTLNNQAKQ